MQKSFSIFLLALTLFASEASATKLFVSNDGKDFNVCGTKTQPCRSISQTIANANAGDTIIVGPGIYGDLDEDGVLGEEGEEFAPSSCANLPCMLHIDKPVKIISEQGAERTIITGFNADSDSVPTAVYISAPGTVFGKKKKGISVAFARDYALRVEADQVTIGYSIFTRAGSGVSFDGQNGKFLNNQVIGVNTDGIILGCNSTLPTQGIQFTGNSISFNGDEGFITCERVSNLTLKKNQFLFNLGVGVVNDGANPLTMIDNQISGNSVDLIIDNGSSVTLKQLSVIGSQGVGLIVDESNIMLSNSQIIGSYEEGIYVTNSTFKVTSSDIFGNGTFDDTGNNCGYFDSSNSSSELTNNYWGSASGPGENPADMVCGNSTNDDAVPFRTSRSIKKKK